MRPTTRVLIIPQCLSLMLIYATVFAHETLSAGLTGPSQKAAIQRKQQEAILKDYAVDLKRLSSLPTSQSSASVALVDSEEQDLQQPEQSASANHESFVIDGGQARLIAQLLQASASAPLPEGRRRLDEAPLETLPTNRRLVAAGTGRQANRARRNQNMRRNGGGSGGHLDKIVDNGSSNSNRAAIPHQALAGMMANNHLDRMASAMKSRLSRADQADNRRGRMQELQRAQMQTGRGQGRRSAARNGGNLGRQESKINNKRQRKALAERPNEFSGRSSDGTSNGNDDDGEELDDDDGDERDGLKSAASRRQSKDDFFNDDDHDDDDRTSSSDQGDHQGAVSRANNGSRMKQAATRQRPNKASRQVGGARQRGGQDAQRVEEGSDNERNDDDEDADSTNARRLTSLLPRRAAGSRSGSSVRPGRRSDEAAADGQAGGEVANSDGSGSGNGLTETNQQEDDVSAASYVRNSATDLQTAAGKHYGGHHYHQMVEVPKKKAYKMSFKRGNHKHEIMKREKLHKHKFHTKFAWHAKEKCKKKKKCKSVGKMTWEYKHDKKKHHHRR